VALASGEAEPAPSAAVREWVAVLLETAEVDALVRRLERERDALGSWWSVAERLGAALAEVGRSWRAQRLSVVEEHLASERLARALARCADAAPTRSTAPVVLLVAAAGDDHTLGLALVELCVRSEGWTTRWVGRRAPFGAVRHYLERHRVDVVGVSASEASVDEESLADEAERYAALCEPKGLALWLGGRGSWPVEPRWGVRIQSLADLRREVASFAD
jgi:hypothetical protein